MKTHNHMNRQTQTEPGCSENRYKISKYGELSAGGTTVFYLNELRTIIQNHCATDTPLFFLSPFHPSRQRYLQDIIASAITIKGVFKRLSTMR